MALSYVWGTQPSKIEADGPHYNELSERRYPLTVQDATEVVRRLGKRYLWVDRYCIDQGNETEKDSMLLNMDIIYESAWATLVALHGDNDQAGLPGVSSTPRSQQLSFKTDTGRLISSCPPISTMIPESIWNTRGWTYQEARLSRRCLFFSEHQIYVVCRQSTWSEALSFNRKTNEVAAQVNSSHLEGELFATGIRGIRSREDLVCDRSDYTKRTLTYQSDVLAAFRGILRRSPFVSLYGVPVMHKSSGINPNTGFALGLLWTSPPSLLGTRRHDFPTWSWASVIAVISQQTSDQHSEYARFLDGDIAADIPQNEAQTEFSLPNGGQHRSLQDVISTQTSNILPENGPLLIVEGTFIPCRVRTWGTQHKLYWVCGKWRHLTPDLRYNDEKWPEPDVDELKPEELVLVLIQWKELQNHSMKRLVLMALNWIDDGHAERAGLLTEYREQFDANLVDQLPRVRKRITLQ